MEIIAGHREEAPLPDSHRHLPMQSQIALMLIVIMLAFGVFASLLNSWIATNNFEENIDRKAASYIQSIFNEYYNHYDDAKRNNFHDKSDEILKDKDIDSVGIYDAQKQVILYLGEESDMPSSVFDSINEDVSSPVIENNIRFYVYRLPTEYTNDSTLSSDTTQPVKQQLTYIILSMNQEIVAQTAIKAFVWTFIVTMLAAVLMMLFAVVVIRRFTGPFDCLSKAMSNAQLGQRGARVKPDGASEIYRMGASFNAMIAVLERREERLLAQKKNLEKQIKDRETAELALNNITSRLQAIYNNVNDGIIVVDRYMSIVSMNPSATKIAGYEKGEMIGQELSLIVKHEFIKIATSSLKGKITGEKLANYETFAKRKSGGTLPVEIGISKMKVSGEEHYLLTIRDIAERKKSEEELNAYKLHLESMVYEQTKDIAESRDAAMAGERAMSTFLANMSHELRTPMHGVLSFASIALRKIDSVPVEKTKEFLTEIRVSGNNLLGIINDLLDLSKMKSGKMDYEYSNTMFSDVVNNIMQEMSVLSEKQQVSAEVSIQGNEIFFHLDEQRISQVVRNLYANAIRFASTDTVVKLDINYQHDDKLIFTMFNYGVRVPNDERDSIFESFIQSSLTSNNAGGTGLGLPICKEIIETGHDGTIYVDKDIDDGAKFIVEIPLVKRIDDHTEDNMEVRHYSR